MSIITPQSIVDMENLKDGKVFLVHCKTPKNWVIKAELTDRTHHVRNPASVMNHIDPQARTVVMGKQELMGLRDWVASPQNPVDAHRDRLLDSLKDALKPPPAPGAPAFDRANTVWVKMQAKTNLTDLASVGRARLAGDKAGVKRFAAALKSPGTLEKLGEILAVDAFNHNTDRFSMTGEPGQPWPNEGDPPLKCLRNVGNVFVSMEDGQDTVLGLDSTDPNTGFKRWDMRLDEAEMGYGQWAGRLLTRAATKQRRALIKLMMEDLESVLGPRNRKIAIARTKRLPADAGRRIERGMRSGADKIRDHVRRQAQRGQAPAGLTDRIAALGW